jgi:uncharacterized protein YbjT (DUF2867 family)
MYVVMGGTGNVGGAVAETLLAHGEAVTVLTRHPDAASSWRERGATVAFGDATDAQSLRSAFAHGSRTFLLNPPGDTHGDAEAAEHRTAATIREALAGSELEKVVLASTFGAQPSKGLGDLSSLWALEEGVRGCGFPAAINRGAYYFSNWLALADVVRESGTLPSMFPADLMLPMVAPADLGRAAAERLLCGGGDVGVCHVEGPERYTPADVAAAFAELFGREVTVAVTPPE